MDLYDIYSLVVILRDSFHKSIDYLTCRRIIEENHNEIILNLIEEKGHKNVWRYVASISPNQVNMYPFLLYLYVCRYDCENENSSLGFFAHYVVEKTDYFKGGVYTYLLEFYY